MLYDMEKIIKLRITDYNGHPEIYFREIFVKDSNLNESESYRKAAKRIFIHDYILQNPDNKDKLVIDVISEIEKTEQPEVNLFDEN